MAIEPYDPPPVVEYDVVVSLAGLNRNSHSSWSSGRLRISSASCKEHPELPPMVPYSGQLLPPEGALRARILYPFLNRRVGFEAKLLSAEPIADYHEWIGRVLQEIPGVGEVTVGKLLAVGPQLPDLLDSPQAVDRLVRLGIPARLAAAIRRRWLELSEWQRGFEQMVRDAFTPAPVRNRLEPHLRERSLWGRWAELESGLEAPEASIRLPFDPFPPTRRRKTGPGQEGGRIVKGWSPKLADQAAAAAGVPNTSPPRVLANLLMELEEAAEDGHVALPLPDLDHRVTQRLRLEPEQLRSYLTRFAGRGELIIEQAGELLLAYSPELHAAEVAIADDLRARQLQGRQA